MKNDNKTNDMIFKDNLDETILDIEINKYFESIKFKVIEGRKCSAIIDFNMDELTRLRDHLTKLIEDK